MPECCFGEYPQYTHVLNRGCTLEIGRDVKFFSLSLIWFSFLWAQEGLPKRGCVRGPFLCFHVLTLCLTVYASSCVTVCGLFLNLVSKKTNNLREHCSLN